MNKELLLKLSDCIVLLIPVLRSDDLVLLCVDYKLTVNQACKLGQYTILLIDNLFASVSCIYLQVSFDAE